MAPCWERPSVNGQGNWSLQLCALVVHGRQRDLRFSAVTTDGSGNVSAPSPVIQLQVGGSGAPTAATPRYASGILSGQATAGSLVTIVDGDVVLGVVAANASGNWQFTPTLSKGKHTIMAEATNSAGDTSLLSGVLTVNA